MGKRSENRERWRKILEDQQASGLSISAYGRQVGIPHSCLFKWRHKLGHPAPVFAEVKVKPVPAVAGGEGGVGGPGPIELRWPGRWSVVVRPGFDRQTLMELLDIVEARWADSAALAGREVGR